MPTWIGDSEWYHENEVKNLIEEFILDLKELAEIYQFDGYYGYSEIKEKWEAKLSDR